MKRLMSPNKTLAVLSGARWAQLEATLHAHSLYGGPLGPLFWTHKCILGKRRRAA